jgi:hypothetical protein
MEMRIEGQSQGHRPAISTSSRTGDHINWRPADWALHVPGRLKVLGTCAANDLMAAGAEAGVDGIF